MQYENRGMQYENRGMRYENRGMRYENHGMRYENHGMRYEREKIQYAETPFSIFREGLGMSKIIMINTDLICGNPQRSALSPPAAHQLTFGGQERSINTRNMKQFNNSTIQQ